MSALTHTASVPSAMAAHDAIVLRRLTECRPEFLRYFRRRLSRPEDAEDALQDFCLKVIRAARTPQDGEKIDAWLSRVLRNTLIDHYRRRATRQRAEVAYESEGTEPVVQADADCDQRPCHCVGDLLPTIRPDYAEIVRRADLNEEPRVRIAAELGLTANNFGVRLHRARRALKAKIEAHCSTCCGSDFLSCDCRASTTGRAGQSSAYADTCNAGMAGASL